MGIDNDFSVSNVSNGNQDLTLIAYSNSEYGYLLSYPSSWFIEEIDSTNVQIYSEEIPQGRRYDFSVLVKETNTEGLTSQQWVEQMLIENRRLVATNELPGELRYNYEESVTLGGQDCYALREVFAFDRNDDRIYCSIGDDIFQFIFPSESNTDTVFNSAENYQRVQEILQSVAFTNYAIENLLTISVFGISWRQPVDWEIFSKEQDDNGEYFVFVGTSEAVNGVENKGVSVMITNTNIYFNYGAGPKLEATSSKENDLDISRTVYGDEVVKSLHYEVSGEKVNDKVYVRCMMGDESFFELGEVQCQSLVASITKDI